MIDKFWNYLKEDLSIKFSKEHKYVIDDLKKMPGAKWFNGAKLNFADQSGFYPCSKSIGKINYPTFGC